MRHLAALGVLATMLLSAGAGIAVIAGLSEADTRISVANTATPGRAQAMPVRARL